MEEPAKPAKPNALQCQTHSLRHGPSGCPICLRPANPEPVVLLPVHDSSLGGIETVADFWRRYGMRSIGLLALGFTSLYTLAWPSSTVAINPAPYQQPIVDLESVLFYGGPTDPAAHQKMLLTLLPVVVSSIKAHPPAYRAEFLTGAIEGIETQVKYASPETFRLTAPRKAWVQIREDFFDDVVWFRLRDDRLDAVQNHRQGDSAAGPPDPPGLDALDAYFEAVQAFVARAGYLSSQACTTGADKSAIAAEFKSLSADTTAQLDTIVAGSEASRAQVASLIFPARTLVRGRRDQACGAGVPSAAALDSDFTSFKSAVEQVRSRHKGTKAN